MTHIKTIIVDDEPHARRYLSELLIKDDEIEILALLKNGREAIDFLSNNKVDLVFLDIHMPGVNGLEVMKRLPESNKPLVIFTTAYDQYAITAFESEALDYLLKPFDIQRLNKSLIKIKRQLKLHEKSTLHEKISQLYENFQDSKSPFITEFILKEKGFEKTIKCKDILWIASSSVYVELNTTTANHLYRVTLNELESQLPEAFMRIHRSLIVNLDKIVKTKYLGNNTYELNMQNGATLISSRSYKSKIMERLS
jgi:two-component system, LytTR family, response regulator